MKGGFSFSVFDFQLKRITPPAPSKIEGELGKDSKIEGELFPSETLVGVKVSEPSQNPRAKKSEG